MPLESAAVEAAADAYATRVLTEASPPEACIDESLGPYVTSMLRMSDLEQQEDFTKIEEFDSLVELLEEHCSMKQRSDAVSALRLIVDALRTGNIPPPVKQPKPQMAPSEVETVELLSSALASTNLATPPVKVSSEPLTTSGKPLAEYSSTPSSVDLDAPFKLDSLIPVDLMGAIDNPSTQSETNNEQQNSRPEEKVGTVPKAGHHGKDDEATKKPVGGAKVSSRSESSSGKSGSDLVTSLFKDTCRSSSRAQESNLEPLQQPATTPVLSEVQSLPSTTVDLYPTVEMLLSMTPNLSEEAAMEAARVADGDVNLAQFIIDGAISSPPVCRHMLSDHGCYRSDCHYSHDIDDCTCLFWLRPSTCSKPDCRFRHGFSPRRVEEGRQLILSQQQETQGMYAFPSVSLPGNNGVGMSMPPGLNNNNMQWAAATRFGMGGGMMMGMAPPPTTPTQSGAISGMMNAGAMTLPPPSWDTNNMMQQQQSGNSSSFANIASRGYSQTASFASTPAGGETTSSATPASSITSSTQFVRIPQDLWNPSVNRNSEAFHIPDPMQRYHEVSKSVKRTDVVDLHYQSMKTFGIVLSSVLPDKLRQQQGEGVWIVTGTGHSVGRSHQKGGGVLEQAVLKWLDQYGYVYRRGKDRNGQTGAILVQRAPS